MNEEAFEDTISRFELEFASGRTPDLHLFLAQIPEDSTLIHELLHTDLELRIRNGHHARVEQYLDQFPNLTDCDEFIDDLIYTELKVRQQYEPGLQFEEFGSRFPKRSDRVFQQWFGVNQQSFGEWVQQSSTSDADSRFRKLKLHSSGGLGNIWTGFDRELGRQVAIKEIKPKFSDSVAHRSRFAREAMITSSLNHPGVVSIYGRGQRADGTLYFAMKYIRGRTLRTAIAEFHDHQNGERGGNRSLEFRRLLQHFLDVCNTVEYAHSLNVVHRDLKPDNIMIGQFGESFVVDWGLAQASVHDLNALLPVGEDDSFCSILREASSDFSIDGTKIGSPGFMSPEQAGGDRGTIGPTSDVYSLGATLFSLISGNDNLALLQLSEDSNSLNTRSATVPKEFRQLNSICRKAMELSPDDRYQSAAGLAEDIENFLLDRPIGAHQESVPELLSRLGRRYRTMVNTSLVALAILSLLSLFAIVRINKARESAVLAQQEAVKANDAESTQRQKAEQRTTQLTDTISVFRDLFSSVDEMGVARRLNKVTLQQAIDGLNSQVDSYEDPIVKSFLLSVLADNNQTLDNPRKSIKQYEMAMRLLQDHDIEETDPLFLDLLLSVGRSKADMGDEDAAIELAKRVIVGSRKLPPEQGERLRFKALRSKAEFILRHDIAVDRREFARTVQELSELSGKLFADTPGNRQIFDVKMLQNEVLLHQGKKAEFLEACEKVVSDWKKDHPLHDAIVVSQVKMAEKDVLFFQNRESAFERLESAHSDAVQLYGEVHSKTLAILARCGLLLLFDKKIGHSEELRLRGLEMLDTCRLRYLESGQIFTGASITTSVIRALNTMGGDENLNRAIAAGEELLANATDAEGISYNLELASLSQVMAITYENLGELQDAEDAYDSAIEYMTKATGSDSARTMALLLQRQKLRQRTAEGKEIVRSTKAKQLDGKIAKLLLFRKSLAKLKEAYADLTTAFANESKEDRPGAMAMHLLSKKLAEKYEEEGQFSNAISVIDDCLKYSILVYGDDSPDARKLNAWKTRLNAKLGR